MRVFSGIFLAAGVCGALREATVTSDGEEIVAGEESFVEVSTAMKAMYGKKLAALEARVRALEGKDAAVGYTGSQAHFRGGQAESAVEKVVTKKDCDQINPSLDECDTKDGNANKSPCYIWGGRPDGKASGAAATGLKVAFGTAPGSDKWDQCGTIRWEAVTNGACKPGCETDNPEPANGERPSCFKAYKYEDPSDPSYSYSYPAYSGCVTGTNKGKCSEKAKASGSCWEREQQERCYCTGPK